MNAPRKALVVEDNEDMAALEAELLAEDGYVSRVVHNGLEGFRVATTDHFDLLVLDINLPGWNGLEMLSSLALVHEELPVIVVSGNPSKHLLGDTEGHNVVGVLPKPFDIDEFRGLVQKVALGHFRARRLDTMKLMKPRAPGYEQPRNAPMNIASTNSIANTSMNP